MPLIFCFLGGQHGTAPPTSKLTRAWATFVDPVGFSSHLERFT